MKSEIKRKGSCQALRALVSALAYSLNEVGNHFRLGAGQRDLISISEHHLGCCVENRLQMGKGSSRNRQAPRLRQNPREEG